MEKIRPILQEDKIKKSNRIAKYLLIFFFGFLIGGGIMWLENKYYISSKEVMYKNVIMDFCEVNNLHDEFILTMLPDLPYKVNYTSTKLNCEELLGK